MFYCLIQVYVLKGFMLGHVITHDPDSSQLLSLYYILLQKQKTLDHCQSSSCRHGWITKWRYRAQRVREVRWPQVPGPVLAANFIRSCLKVSVIRHKMTSERQKKIKKPQTFELMN